MAHPTRASDLISDLLAAGLTRSQIARGTGLSPGYITMLKQGERGRRIGLSAYMALRGLADASLPRPASEPPEALQSPPPTRWTPPGG